MATKTPIIRPRGAAEAKHVRDTPSLSVRFSIKAGNVLWHRKIIEDALMPFMSSRFGPCPSVAMSPTISAEKSDKSVCGGGGDLENSAPSKNYTG
jgi:hypothetical protein